MKRRLFYILISLCFFIGVTLFVVFVRNDLSFDSKTLETLSHDDVLDAPFVIGEKQFTLTDGKGVLSQTPDSSQVETLTVYGQPTYGDLDGDGDEDAALLLVHEQGGSGTFFYAALVMNKTTYYHATNALFLGDRIAPQTAEIKEGKAIFNYVERNEGEPMTTPPSVGKSLVVAYDGKKNEIRPSVAESTPPNTEDITNSLASLLTSKSWVWTQTVYSDGVLVKPKTEGKFVVTVTRDGSFTVTTDCNDVQGQYVVALDQITFNQMVSTKMYCEGSQEAAFTKMLKETKSYFLPANGELIMTLLDDTGSVFFK